MSSSGDSTDAGGRPGAGRLAAIAAGVGAGAMLLYRMGPSVADPDLWHEMALARESIALGHVPWRDHFAYTETLPVVVHHEWGAGMLALALARTLGGPGIVLARFALTAALAAVTLGIARRRGASLPVIAFLAPLAILLIDEGFSAIRAQMYSFAFFALLLRFLDEDERGNRRWLLAFVPMVLVWVNVHGGFLAGAGVLAAHAVDRWLRGGRPVSLVAAGLAMAVLVAVNPYGLHAYEYLARAATMNRPHVDEWLPIWRTSNPTKLALFVASLTIAAYAVASAGVRRASGVLALAFTALSGAQRSRLLAFYAIIWLAYVPGWLQGTTLGVAMVEVFRRRGAILAAVWSVATVAFLTMDLALRPWELLVPGGPIPGLGSHVDYPVGAVEYLKEAGFRGNMMVPFDWGAYVSWKLAPAVKVGMDGRYEVAYPDRVVDANYRLYMGEPGWDAVLAADPTDLVLIPNRLPLARLIPTAAAGWRRVYADRAFTVYARPGLASLPVVDRSRSNREFLGTFP